MKFTKIKCFLVGLCSAVFFLKYPDVVAGDHEKNLIIEDISGFESPEGLLVYQCRDSGLSVHAQNGILPPEDLYSLIISRDSRVLYNGLFRNQGGRVEVVLSGFYEQGNNASGLEIFVLRRGEAYVLVWFERSCPDKKNEAMGDYKALILESCETKYINVSKFDYRADAETEWFLSVVTSTVLRREFEFLQKLQNSTDENE